MLDLLIPYVPPEIITLVLFFVAGVLVGAGVKKAIVGVLLMIAGVIVATFAGINIWASYSNQVYHIPAIIAYMYHKSGWSLAATPLVFIVGFVIGFWKG